MPAKSLRQLQERPARAREFAPVAPEKPKPPARYVMTEKRKLAYDFICAYIQKNNYGPSVREVGAAIGVTSPCSVDRHLNALQEMGYICRDRHQARSIRISPLQIEGQIQNLILKTQMAILDECHVCLEVGPLRRALRASGWRV